MYGQQIKVSTRFTPPFVYSFQCASSLVSSYAGVFVYALLLAISLPILSACILSLFRSMGFSSGSQLFWLMELMLEDEDTPYWQSTHCYPYMHNLHLPISV
jgi:hypothetical protein